MLKDASLLRAQREPAVAESASSSTLGPSFGVKIAVKTRCIEWTWDTCDKLMIQVERISLSVFGFVDTWPFGQIREVYS